MTHLCYDLYRLSHVGHDVMPHIHSYPSLIVTHLLLYPIARLVDIPMEALHFVRTAELLLTLLRLLFQCLPSEQ